MALRRALLLSSTFGLLGRSYGGPLLERQATPTTAATISTTSASSTTTASTSTTQTVSITDSSAVNTTPSSTISAPTTGIFTDPDVAQSTMTSGTQPAVPTGSTIPGSTLNTCTSNDVQSKFSPFCEPLNGTSKVVDQNYYITWDPTALYTNSSVQILANFANANTSSTDAVNAWSSDFVDGILGYVIIAISSDWLQGTSSNPLQLDLVDKGIDSTGKAASRTLLGPIINVVTPAHYAAPPPTSINKLGMEIGIPIGVAAFFLILFGLFCGMRKQRRIDVAGIRSRLNRKRGYGVRKSRAQRVGQRGSHSVLQNEPDEDAFRDDPVEMLPRGRSYNDHELSTSPPGEHFMEGSGGENAFRDEVARQRAGRE